MEIRADRRGSTAIAGIQGRLESSSNADEFLEKVRALVEPGVEGLLFDCNELTYISSSGLRSIAIIVNDCQDGGIRTAACRMIPPVRSVFEISGFDQIMAVRETLEAALEAVT